MCAYQGARNVSFSENSAYPYSMKWMIPYSMKKLCMMVLVGLLRFQRPLRSNFVTKTITPICWIKNKWNQKVFTLTLKKKERITSLQFERRNHTSVENVTVGSYVSYTFERDWYIRLLRMYLEQPVRKCSSKQVFSKFSQYSRENICVGVSSE